MFKCRGYNENSDNAIKDSFLAGNNGHIFATELSHAQLGYFFFFFYQGVEFFFFKFTVYLLIKIAQF